MSQQTRTTLKGYFNSGDKPTEAQFADFIDSVPNITSDSIYSWVQVSKGYADYSDAGTSKFILLASAIPAGVILVRAITVVKSYFTGGTVSACVHAPYLSPPTTPCGNSVNVFNTSIVNALYPHYQGPYPLGLAGSTWDLYIRMISTGGNLNALTTGNLDFYYLLQKVF